jgi:hypothetical protein
MKINDIHIGDKKKEYTRRKLPNGGYVYKVHKDNVYLPAGYWGHETYKEPFTERKFYADNIVYTDAEGLLHRDDGPAIISGDNTHVYFIHGRQQS